MSRNQHVEDKLETPFYQSLSGFQSHASSCSRSSSLARPFWAHFSWTSSGTFNFPLGFLSHKRLSLPNFAHLLIAVWRWSVRIGSSLGRSTWLSRGRGWTWDLWTWSGSGTRSRGAILSLLSLLHFFCHAFKLSLHLGICLHGWEVYKFRDSTCRKISKIPAITFLKKALEKINDTRPASKSRFESFGLGLAAYPSDVWSLVEPGREQPLVYFQGLWCTSYHP